MDKEDNKLQLVCPFCGYRMPIKYDKSAKCKGLFIRCKSSKCKKLFEIVINK